MTAALGGEQVEFIDMHGRETLSRPFEFTVHIAAQLGEIDLAPHLGERIGIAYYEGEDIARYFNGVLCEALHTEESGDGFFYELQLKPFTHFMDNRSGFAIYQEKTVIDILKDVFDRAKITDYELRIKDNYEPFEYCVQYDESDFAFISRLMEQEGLYYFYEHTDKKHVMVICDKAATHKPGTVQTLAFNAAAATSQSYNVSDDMGGHNILTTWQERVASSGHERVSLRDYNFKQPTEAVEGKASDKQSHPSDTQEHYSYPGQFVNKGRADRLSKVRLEEYRALRKTYVGKTMSKGLCAGATIKVEHHPTGRFNAEYMIIAAEHRLRSQSYRAGSGTEDQNEVFFTAIPAATQFRALRVTPRPSVRGIESAIVTGPDNETIYTDEYGRVKVRFHWDRSKTEDENSTCWIRVSQTGGLGNIILPRVGHEVLVDFLHGDPDQPVVVGRVFNAEHMPVYPLPQNKTRALWRTLTYGKQKAYDNADPLDTGEPKANEIRFEDQGGEEEVFIHAERDMNVRVRYDKSAHIGHNEELKVGYDRDRYVKNDEKVKIDGNRTYELEKNETNTINRGDRETTLKSGNDTLKVQTGNISISADKGKIKIEAMQEILLMVGKSTVKLTPMGVDVNGTMINVKAKAMSEVSAGAVLTQKGALIKIN
jgi:type VI secretion system secreted protein VgrG